MATKIDILSFVYLYFFCINFSKALPEADESKGDINSWCETTPHPEPCKYFLSQDQKYLNPTNSIDFRRMMVQVALEKALQEQSCTENLENQCHSKRRKLAWLDCNTLFQHTIYQLNQTLEALKINTSNSFDFDAQTWLSAALTNIEICRSGSVELNVTKFIAPLVSNNVSELISNSLAVNGALPTDEKQQESDKNEDYPTWVTRKDRKLLQIKTSWAKRANVIVAKDGSGKFKSIQSAINYAAKVKEGNGRYIIYVKRGVYRENIAIPNTLSKIMLVGQGLRYTIITGSRSVVAGFTTYSSATAGIDGVGFIARGITFRNTAGPQKGQAVALRSSSDLSVYYACSFEGYQDTLFVLAQRQFYKSCYIYGTVDFIFGNAAVVFQNCIIYVRKPLHGQANVVTAQGRGDPYQNTGISIHNSRIMAAPDLKPVQNEFRTYLGRPWQQYSRTVVMNSYLDTLVHPDGWLAWLESDFAWETLYYGEYKNFGPAAATDNRVKWPGYHIITSANEASKFTAAKLISGQAWLYSTGVPFILGL
ncbi:Pectinesterase [Heracleum sosnowskyi]|uniref:Pectinesterase n=1 Tax=Heracleum sosnowskyi TaxID=360622 RepID=A0AAD8HGC8_9APIA|nr:Pectinesterase [Heracleum sosnowskyi]